MTAEWEYKLSRIAKWEFSADEFMNGITAYVRSLVCQQPTGDISAVAPVRESIGRCPSCGKDIYEGKSNYYCANRECKFVIWKEVCKKTITKPQVKKLLENDALIFSALASYSGLDDMCAVNHKRIAVKCGLSLSTVKTRLKRMDEAGYIAIIPGQTKPYINTFVLLGDGTGRSLPKVSPYGYITVVTPCGELTELVTKV